ncbi:MAG: TonB-dependent receptor [Acidobacteriia bacterium]|nr:TonB-dependent receptor [Terriglobia bacterium]
MLSTPALRHTVLRAFVFAAIALFAVSTFHVQAQTVTGTISGTVLDPSGAVVPNAEISVTNQDTGVVRTTTGTSDGLYSVPSLLPGRYSVQVKAEGFNVAQVQNVVVNVGTETRADLHLEVGTTSQAITVSESIPTVETTSTDVSQVMSQDLIKIIPLNARDLQQLSVIQPGVQQTFTSSFGKQVSVGGDRVANNRFLQEGIDLTWTFRTSPVSLASNILMGADAVKEFKVISENPPVEYGELSGGITSTTFKSGTNTFHGTLFEYYRNSAFDARNFFDGPTIPPLHRHQYGGQIGGPIIKDKTFFFADYESLRSDAAASFVAAVPSLAGRNSAVPIIQQIFFGATAAGPVGTNTPLLPACNDGNYATAGAGATCNFNSTPNQAVRENYGVIKVDHSFGAKDSLSGSYNIDQSTEFEPTQLAITADDVYMRRQVFSLQETHIFSPSIVNTFRGGVQRINYAGNLDIYTSAPIDPRLYVNANPAIVHQSPFPQIPAITIPGVTNIGAPALGFNYVPRYIGYTSMNFSDDVNIVHGKHAFQIGAQVKRWYDNIENYMSTPRGAIGFGSLGAFLSNSPAASFAWWVQNYTDPVNGQTYNSTFARGMRLMSYGVYAEDTYKMKPNLTVTYGLRWEYATSPSEEANRISNLYGAGCTAYNCATPTVGAPWYHPPKNNFAPRVGINWDPFGKGKTSVRAGAGVFFAEMEDDYWYPSLASQPPFTVAVSLPGAITFPFNNQPGTTFSNTACTANCSNTALNNFLAAPTGGLFSHETYGGAEFPYFKTPTKYAYNLTVQQELPGKLTFLVAYVGSQGRHQGRTFSYQDFNQTTIETPGQLPMVNGVPIPGAVINPNCTSAGAITCYYWAGSLNGANPNIGGQNVNLLANPSVVATPSGPVNLSPYATNCILPGVPTQKTGPCYNNPYWANSITGNITDGNSYYNALQVVLQRPVSPGLFARFNYTFAECIADSGDNLPGQYTNGGSAAFPLITQHGAGRGRCSYLSTQSANFTLTYETHWGNNLSSRPLKTAVTGWQLSSQTLVSSGIPFTVTSGTDNARYVANAGPNGAPGGDRPDWAAPNANCPDPSPRGAVGLHNFNGSFVDINTACFAIPVPGYLGNVGPLVFRGPSTINTDLSLRKTIPVTEGKTLTFSADMFNAFNRANFSVPTSLNVFGTTGSRVGNFGAINFNNPYATVTTSRQFQISGRFAF